MLLSYSSYPRRYSFQSLGKYVSHSTVVSNINAIILFFTPTLGTSDHNGVKCLHKWRVGNNIKTKSRKVWRYKFANFEDASTQLDPLDWEDSLSGDVDQAWEKWKLTFISVMEEYIHVAQSIIPDKQEILPTGK